MQVTKGIHRGQEHLCVGVHMTTKKQSSCMLLDVCGRKEGIQSICGEQIIV